MRISKSLLTSGGFYLVQNHRISNILQGNPFGFRHQFPDVKQLQYHHKCKETENPGAGYIGSKEREILGDQR